MAPARAPSGGITVATFGVSVGAGENSGDESENEAQPTATGSVSADNSAIADTSRRRRNDAVLGAGRVGERCAFIGHHGTCHTRLEDAPRECNNASVPKIIGETLADHRDQVRQRLFAALKQLIVDRGYDAITLADVAAEAGVGRTAVYNHFPDKESVLLAWAMDETERYLASLRAELETSDDPLEQLRIFIRMQMSEFATHHTRLAGVGTALSAEGRLAIRDHIAPMMQLLGDIVQRAIDAGRIPPQDAVKAVPMISVVTAVRFPVTAEGDALAEAIATVTEFVLHGLGAA